MHIPDGFLDGKTLAITGALSAGGLAAAGRQVGRTLPRSKIPLMGLGAAFVFAAQMLNFPVLGGTSGHLLGGVLAAVLLGPGAAAIVIACVLTVQALLFSDGGVLALGANIFNMSFIGGVCGYYIYRAARGILPGLRGRVTAVFFAAWLSTVLASVMCAGELSLSGTLPPGVVFPTMVGVHALIGVGEGLITALVILAIARARPDLLEAENLPNPRGAGLEFLAFGLVVALGLAIFVSPYACTWPDGLDQVARKFGFEGHTATLIRTWIPNYKMPGISSAAIATAIAGAIGTLIMFGLACVVGRLLVKNEVKAGRQAEPAGHGAAPAAKSAAAAPVVSSS
jgi:cobalt/nickel transport system permease protein